MTNEVLKELEDSGLKLISAFLTNYYVPLQDLLKPYANSPGEWKALYNKEKDLLVIKRTSHDQNLGTKLTISNCFDHIRGHMRAFDIIDSDGYNALFRLLDRIHQQFEIKDRRRFPFCHRSKKHFGIESHFFDIVWCFRVENTRVVYRAVH